MIPTEVYKDIKEEYDGISPSMCVLKWYHLEMHLSTGQAHSCYHCPQEPLQLDQDLHNTDSKIKQREQMMNGERPDVCSYCWDAEDAGAYSDRITLTPVHRMHDPNVITTTASKSPKEHVYPRYLEMSFSNTCQMQCTYCGPEKSSTWEQSITKRGEYELSEYENFHQYNHWAKRLYDDENNPFVQKFMEWFPEAKKHLHTLRITGGEPLLHPQAFQLAKEISESEEDRLKLGLHINSNLSLSNRRVSDMCKFLQKIPNSKIYASIDTWGTHAEWIRTGLHFGQFQQNIKTIIDHNVDIGIMCTFNILSIPKFKEMLLAILEMKKDGAGCGEYDQHDCEITLDTPYLTIPPHLSALIIDDKMLSELEDTLVYMQRHTDDNNRSCFSSGEYTKVKRVYQWIKRNRFTGEELKRHRKDFVKFINIHDKRTKANSGKWHKTFKDLHYFYEMCNE